MTDDKLFLTPAEAESLLEDGEYVHNFAQGGVMLLGCDYERADAIKAFHAAKSIEIGGEACQRMGHALAVYDPNERLTFFAADRDKVAAFEADRGKQEAAA